MITSMRTVVVCVALAAVCAGCGKLGFGSKKAVESAFRAYEAALNAGDVEALGKTLVGDAKAELSGPDAAPKLELIKAFRPKVVLILNVTVSGDKATLEVEGDVDGQKATGIVRMAKDGKDWKVAKEEWSISMTMDGSSAMDMMGSGEVVPFMADAKKPPTAQTVFEGHQGEVSKLAFTPDGSQVISASYGDYSVRLWDAATGEQLAEKVLGARPRGMAITRNGSHVLVATVGNTVLAFSLDLGTLGEPSTVVGDAGDEIALSPDGKMIAATAYQKPVTIWSYPEGKAVTTLKDSEKARVLAFTPAGDKLVAAGDGNTYNVWDTKTWKGTSATIKKVAPEGQATGVAVSPDGKLLAVVFTDSSIVVIDLESRKEVHNFFVADESTLAVAFSRDGALLVTANRDKAYLWEAKTAKRVGRLKDHAGDIYSLAFSPDGSGLVSGGADRKIILWRSGPPVASGAVDSSAAAVEAPAAPARAKPPVPGKPRVPGTATAVEAKGPLLEVKGAQNLVANAGANDGLTGWQKEADAATAEGPGINPHFVVKYDGMIWQDVKINAKPGSYVVVAARANTERVEPDGDQTGLPYMYGNWINSQDRNKFNGYLNADEMTLRDAKPNEWGVVYGIYAVPSNTAAIRLSLQIADGGKPHNGSAGRFDDVSVFVAPKEPQAQKLLDTYKALAGKLAAAEAAAAAKAAKEAAKKKPVGKGAKGAVETSAMDAPVGKIYIGRTIDEARAELGFPKMQFKRGARVVLVYENREISASDGHTVDKDTAAEH